MNVLQTIIIVWGAFGVIGACVMGLLLHGSRAQLAEAYEQIDEDEEYIAELRGDLKIAEEALAARRAPSRKAGIIAKARA